MVLWSCSRCTYENDGSKHPNRCEVCDSARENPSKTVEENPEEIENENNDDPDATWMNYISTGDKHTKPEETYQLMIGDIGDNSAGATLTSSVTKVEDVEKMDWEELKLQVLDDLLNSKNQLDWVKCAFTLTKQDPEFVPYMHQLVKKVLGRNQELCKEGLCAVVQCGARNLSTNAVAETLSQVLDQGRNIYFHEDCWKVFQEETEGLEAVSTYLQESDQEIKNVMLLLKPFTKRRDLRLPKSFLPSLVKRIKSWKLSEIMDNVTDYNQLVLTGSEIATSSSSSSSAAAAAGAATSPLNTESSAFVIDPVLQAGIDIGLAFMKSDKLRYRRFGLEQFGELSQTMTTSKSAEKQVLTDYFKQLGVFEDVFGERMDERVVPCSEQLLRYAKWDKHLVQLLMGNQNITKSRAIRKLLCNSFQFLPTKWIVYIWEKLLQLVLEHGDEGAYKVILQSDKQKSVINKGQEVMDACLEALYGLLFANSVDLDYETTVASKLGIGSQEISDLLGMFGQVISQTKDNSHFTFANRCLECIRDGRSDTILRRQQPDAVLVAYKLVRRIVTSSSSTTDLVSELDQAWDLKTFILDEFEDFVVNSPIRRLYEYKKLSASTRSMIPSSPRPNPPSSIDHDIFHIEQVPMMVHDDLDEDEEDLANDESKQRGNKYSSMSWRALEALLIEHEKSRLMMMSTMLRCKIVDFDIGDMRRLWTICCIPIQEGRGVNDDDNKGNSITQETFMTWLRLLSFDEKVKCFGKNVSALVLQDLFGKKLNRFEIGPTTYHCLQSHFVFVNGECCTYLRAIDSEAVSKEFEFRNQAPPTGLDLVGRRVSVLFDNGKMVKGKLTKYISWSNKYQIEYVNGVVEEKDVGCLNKWYLLPSIKETMAGNVTVFHLAALFQELIGLDVVWDIVTCRTSSSLLVKAQAYQLLLNLYSCGGIDEEIVDQQDGPLQFINRFFEDILDLVDVIEYVQVFLTRMEISMPPSSCMKKIARMVGPEIPLDISTVSETQELNLLQFQVHTKMTLLEFLQIMSKESNFDTERIQFHVERHSFSMDNIPFNMTFQDLGFNGIEQQMITVVVVLVVSVEEMSTVALDSRPRSSFLDVLCKDQVWINQLFKTLVTTTSENVYMVWEFIQKLPPLEIGPLRKEDLHAVGNEDESFWRFVYQVQLDMVTGQVGRLVPSILDVMESLMETDDDVRLFVAFPILLMGINSYASMMDPVQCREVSFVLSRLVLRIHMELERREKLSKDCEYHFLGIELKNDRANATLLQRSLTPPPLSHELIQLKPPVCAFCLNTKHLIRAVMDAIDLIESIDQVSVLVEKSSDLLLRFIQTFVIRCKLGPVRSKVCQMVKNLVSREDGGGWKKDVASCLRQVELELESKSFVHKHCDDFFLLFQEFVPKNDDYQLVHRITKLLLDWPMRASQRGTKPGAHVEMDEGYSDDDDDDDYDYDDDYYVEGVGNHLLQVTREEGESETHLFVGFTNTLVHILTQYPNLRQEIRSTQLDRATYGHSEIIKVLWDQFLMDDQNDQPFCDTKDSRFAVYRLIRTLAETDQLLMLVERFSNQTPVPLKGNDDNAPDWEFVPVPGENEFTSVFKGRNKTGFVGLVNRGATCYINSLLQLLFHVQGFRKTIIDAPVSPPSMNAKTPQETKIVIGWECICSGINDLTAQNCHICGTAKTDNMEMVTQSFYNQSGSMGNGGGNEAHDYEILRQLQRAFRFMQDGRRGCYDPNPLVEACRTLNLQYAVTSQNDASEFFDKLLDRLEANMSPSALDLFLGQQTRIKRCHVCGLVSTSREESFYRLELMAKDNNVEKRSLRECLHSFAEPEILTGDNKVDCQQCQTRTTCTFVSCITKLPEYLFIHPKRFTFDLMTMETVKLNHYLEFPLTLDLFPYTKPGIGKNNSDLHLNNTVTEEELEAFKNEECQYILSGVIVHRGRAGGGHYYAFKKKGNKGEWFRFDDAKVASFNHTQLLEAECFGGNDTEKNAFMLLYEKDKSSRKRSPGRRGYNEEDLDNQEGEGATGSIARFTPLHAHRHKSFEEKLHNSYRIARGKPRRSSSSSSSFTQLKDTFIGTSLKETTLSGLIESHRDWQSQRFNALLDEEVRISNLAYSRQALLYDPLIESMALDCLKGIDDAFLKTRPYLGEAIVRIFQHVALHAHSSNHHHQTLWLQQVGKIMKMHPKVARNVVDELLTNQPRFLDDHRQVQESSDLAKSMSHLKRLQKFCQALRQVGIPLLGARGVEHQLYSCEFTVPSFHSMLSMVQLAIEELVSHSSTTKENEDEAEPASSLVEKFLRKIMQHQFHQNTPHVWFMLGKIENLRKTARKLAVICHLVDIFMESTESEVLMQQPEHFTMILQSLQEFVAHILPAGCGDALRSKAFQSKVFQMYTDNYDNNATSSVIQSFIVKMCDMEYMEGKHVVQSFCLKTLRENCAFINNNKKKRVSLMARELLVDLEYEPKLDLMVNSVLQEFKRNCDEDAEDIAVTCANKVCASVANFGCEQYVFHILAALDDLGYTPTQEEIQIWVRIVVEENRRIVHGFDQAFIRQLANKILENN